MRVRNKEIRSKRHRKEQTVKAALKAIRAQYADKKPTPVAKPKTQGTTKKAPAKK